MRHTTVLLVLLASACSESATDSIDPNLAVDVTQLSCVPSPSACTPAQVAIDAFGSSHELDTMLAGAWRLCGPDNVHLHAGIELTPAHEVYFLEQAADGSCRRTTQAPAADWYTFDISEQNPPGTYQLVLEWPDQATMSMVPRFSKKTTALVDAFFGFEFRRLH